jgi:hypothetical protein
MKAGGGNEIVEKNKNKRGFEKSREKSVEYLAVGCKVAVVFVIIFEMCKREGV